MLPRRGRRPGRMGTECALARSCEVCKKYKVKKQIFIFLPCIMFINRSKYKVINNSHLTPLPRKLRVTALDRLSYYPGVVLLGPHQGVRRLASHHQLRPGRLHTHQKQTHGSRPAASGHLRRPRLRRPRPLRHSPHGAVHAGREHYDLVRSSSGCVVVACCDLST